MSWQTCAAKVEAGDPDRFAATMIAPVAVRAKLFPLYALNLEIAEAAWASPEPLVCMMRLQFWQDALAAIRDGRLVPGHEVLAVVAPVIAGHDLAPLFTMIDARRRDVARASVADLDGLIAHLGDLTAGLMQMVAALLGGVADDPVVRDVAMAGAIANWSVALPALEANGLHHWPGTDRDGISQLARAGLTFLNRADQRALPASVRPALWPAFAARHRLWHAELSPQRALDGALGPSDLRRTLLLTGTRLTGLI